MPNVVLFVVIFLILLASEKIGWLGVTGIAIITLFVFGFAMDYVEKAQQRKIDGITQRINNILDSNSDLVERTALHTFKKSHMGIVNADRFHKEIITFLEVNTDHSVHAQIASLGTNLSSFYYKNIADIFAQNTLINIERGRQITRPVSDMTPLEYEVSCANLFRKSGWVVETTSVTGDQGVDLVITKGRKIGAVQCKRYAAPVGNSAVQEVAAGKSHYRATFAIVVSPSGFTKSARQLADSTGVHLIHHEEIHRFSV